MLVALHPSLFPYPDNTEQVSWATQTIDTLSLEDKAHVEGDGIVKENDQEEQSTNSSPTKENMRPKRMIQKPTWARDNLM